MTRANVWTPRKTTLLYTSPTSQPLPGHAPPPRRLGTGRTVQVRLQMQSVKSISGASPSTNRPSNRRPASPSPSSSRDTSNGASKRGNARKKKEKEVAEKPKDLSSAALFEAVKARMREADDADRQAEEVFSTFERKLGAALKKKGQKIAELLRDWDKDGTGEVKKMQFRQKVRGSLGIKANNHEIDKFFNSMDEDGGGPWILES